MSESLASREGEAREAADALLPAPSAASRTRHPNLRSYGTVRNIFQFRFGQNHSIVCCGLMTDVRRMFCLLVTFDLILTFVLWGIYVKLKDSKFSAKCNYTDSTLRQNLCDEVICYNFNSSLFDAFICAFFRFLLLVIAYGLFRLKNPSMIAVTTFFTSLYVISKVFVYTFKTTDKDPVSYILLITSFIIAWVETWFLDCRLLPLENSDSLSRIAEGIRAGGGGGGGGGESDSILRGRMTHDNYDSNFCTPEEGSEEEDDTVRSPYAFVNAEYRRKADEAWRQAWNLLNLLNGWKRETSVGDIVVHSQRFNNVGKVLRLEATVDGSVNSVFQLSTLNFNDLPKWNSTVLESRILQQLSPSMDVTYSVTAEAGRGMVSSRDFVTVRHWKPTETGGMLSAGCAVVHHLMPETTQHVRGENRVTGWLFLPMPENPNQCLLKMVVSTDIKGWIPQVVVDQAVTGVLIESIQNLRKYVATKTTLVDV